MSNVLSITGQINMDTYQEVLDFIQSVRKPIQKEMKSKKFFKSNNEMQEHFNRLNELKNVTIVINSAGGYIKDVLIIYDLLSLCNFNITTLVCGYCVNEALALLMLGKKRYITSNSCIRMKDNIKFGFKEDRQEFIKCCTENSGIEANKFSQMLSLLSDKNWYYNASEAVIEGFATDIITDISQVM